jgi:hypothetical protein
MAIAWLHVVREHPFFLRQYASIFQVTSKPRYLFRFLTQLIVNFAGWAGQFFRSLSTVGFGIDASRDFPAIADVLIVSHLVNIEHLERAGDFYFDTLGCELEKHGHRVILALINHTGRGYSRHDKGVFTCASSNRFILGRSMSFFLEFANFRMMWREANSLRCSAFEVQDPFGRALTLRASLEAMSGSSRAACRIRDQIGELVRRFQPKLLVTTYEGHAWERLAFDRARTMNPKIRCVGYQHAAMFKLQHALRRSLGTRYDPDGILASGPAAKRQFDCVETLGKTEIQILGSNRAGSRMHLLDAATRQRRKASPVCLVIPEGLELESALLFEFSLKCAQVLKSVIFLWRLHPAASFSKLAEKHLCFRDLPSNIIISESSLEDDTARASWALYRGTSAIVSAVLGGAAPVYLRVEGEMTIDPLYELSDARAIVSSIDDFVSLVDGEKREFPTDAQAEMAARYCMEVFSPMAPEVVVDYLDRIDRSSGVQDC